MPSSEENQVSSNKEKKERRKFQKIAQPYSKIALVGFRGIGKSTISTELSKVWNTRIISLDKYIEKKYGQNIKHIILDKGWSFFREEEALSLKKISEEEPPLLLDTGGGIIEKADSSPSYININLLKEVFFSVYLYMPKEDAIQRLKKSSSLGVHPFLVGNIHDIYERREPLYRETASAVIDITDATKEEITKRILDSL